MLGNAGSQGSRRLRVGRSIATGSVVERARIEIDLVEAIVMRVDRRAAGLAGITATVLGVSNIVTRPSTVTASGGETRHKN